MSASSKLFSLASMCYEIDSWASKGFYKFQNIIDLKFFVGLGLKHKGKRKPKELGCMQLMSVSLHSTNLSELSCKTIYLFLSSAQRYKMKVSNMIVIGLGVSRTLPNWWKRHLSLC